MFALLAFPYHQLDIPYHESDIEPAVWKCRYNLWDCYGGGPTRRSAYDMEGAPLCCVPKALGALLHVHHSCAASGCLVH